MPNAENTPSGPINAFLYTCDKQVLLESVGAFSARQLSRFSPQLVQFRRSLFSGKMLTFEPRGFLFEPVRIC